MFTVFQDLISADPRSLAFRSLSPQSWLSITNSIFALSIFNGGALGAIYVQIKNGVIRLHVQSENWIVSIFQQGPKFLQRVLKQKVIISVFLCTENQMNIEREHLKYGLIILQSVTWVREISIITGSTFSLL